MRQTKVAKRYAKALFDLAHESGKTEEVKKDLDLIRQVYQRDLHVTLQSPVISSDKKSAIFDAIFSSHVAALTVSFFKLIFTKGRSIAVIDILDAFAEMYRAHNDIKVVELTTAVEVTQAVKENIKSMLGQNDLLKGKSIELKEKVDPSILGGLVVQVDDKLFDLSIKHDLQSIKQQFIKNMYVKDESISA